MSKSFVPSDTGNPTFLQLLDGFSYAMLHTSLPWREVDCGMDH